jgi:hypothetical protein
LSIVSLFFVFEKELFITFADVKEYFEKMAAVSIF